MLRIPRYRETTPDDARGRLSLDFARAAFDTMNRMGPAWRTADLPKAVIVAPKILIHRGDGTFVKSLEFGAEGNTADESVTNVYNKLVQHAAKPDTVVFAVGADSKSRAFTYDAANDTFVPKPGVSPGCCGTCGNCKWPQQKP